MMLISWIWSLGKKNVAQVEQEEKSQDNKAE
jgi:hypothetical protein